MATSGGKASARAKATATKSARQETAVGKLCGRWWSIYKSGDWVKNGDATYGSFIKVEHTIAKTRSTSISDMLRKLDVAVELDPEDGAQGEIVESVRIDLQEFEIEEAMAARALTKKAA